MLLYKSSLPKAQLPSRRKYGEVARKHGVAWRSVSAEPSYASSSLSPHSASQLALRERSTIWSGAPAAQQAQGGRPWTDFPSTDSSPLPTPPQTGKCGAGLSTSTSTSQSTKFNPAELRGKRINSVHVRGVLSDWSAEFPAKVVAETMHVTFDEATSAFDSTRSTHLHSSMAASDEHMEKRQKAHALFDTVAERRGILGMCGDVGLGPEAGLIPETNAEKMRTTKRGTASCGPIYSPLTERPERQQNSIQRAMEDTGVRPQAQPPQGKKSLQFELLGADEGEPNVFYFEQTDVRNPFNTGWLKWRLSCFVDRVWQSAAPRPYGPSRDWGGAWGGIDAPFMNSSQQNQPGNAKIVGGYWQKIPRFVMHVVDEVTDRPDFQPPSPLLPVPAGTVLPTAGTLPAFESVQSLKTSI